MTAPHESSARIAVRSRREAMDWSLVLISQGIESVIEFSDASGWSLVVDAAARENALQTLEKYRAENRRWPWRQIVHESIVFDWGSLAWMLIICLFFSLEEQGVDLRSAGLMDSEAVSRGEWWRLFTAIFLHADLGHLASNAGFGLIFLGLCLGRYGTGVGLFAAYLAGTGGNVIAWWLDARHHSLGASGMVLGALGLLAAQSVPRWRKRPPALKFAATGAGAAIMLFLLLGSNPGTDLAAHAGGFLSGILLGAMLSLLGSPARNSAANGVAGGLFLLMSVLPWWLALRHGPHE